MQRLLVIGVDGMLGANIAAALAGEFHVSGVSRTVPVWFEHCEVACIAGDNPAALPTHLNQQRPDWVVYCPETAANSWRRRPEAPPALLAEAHKLAVAARDAEIPLTLLSTDGVFQGPRMFQDESARGFAAHELAQQSLRVEQTCEAAGALVVRTHAYGWSPCREEPNLVETAWRHSVDRLPLPVDSRRYATPILATDLALLLVRAFRLELRGILHLAGAERTAPRRFVEELAQACGQDAGLLLAEQPGAEPSGVAPQESSLNTLRARTLLKTPMPLLRPGLERLAAQLNNGHRQRLREGWPAVSPRRAA